MGFTPDGWLSMLRVILAGAVLLFVPGYFLQSLLLRTYRLSALARIPISFAFSTGSIALIAIAVSVLGGSLDTVQGLVWVECAVLAFVWVVRTKPHQHLLRPRFQCVFPGFWPGLLVVLFAAGCAVLAHYGGTWLSHTADGFYHLAAVRRQIETGTAIPQGLFFVYEQAPMSLNVTAGTWHVVLSLFSLWSGVDIAWLWLHLPTLLAPLLVLSFYSFANVLLKNPWLALLGTVLQVVLYDKLDFRASGYPNQIGFILLWTAFVLVFTYLDSGGLKLLILIEALVLAMVSWHLLMAEFFFVSIGSYLCLRWLAILLTQHRAGLDQENRRLANILLPAVIIGVPFFIMRVMGGRIVYNSNWLAISKPTFRSSLNLGFGFSIIGPLHLFKVDPRWRFAPFRFAFYLFAYLTSLLLIPSCLKLRRPALFLFSSSIAVPLVLLNPFLITFLQGKMTDIGLIRLVLLPSYGLILAWFFWEYTGKWVRALFSLPPMGDWLKVRALRSVAGLVIGGVILALMGYILARQGVDNLIDLYSPASENTYSLANNFEEMRYTDQAPYLFLSQHATPGAVVASDPDSSYYLGGLTGRSVVSVPYTHAPPATGPTLLTRIQDSIDLMDPAVALTETVRLLDQYGVCLIWVDSRMESADAAASRRKFEDHPDIFERVFEDSDVSIYSYLAYKGKCLE